jgi:CHAT domain-containing protein/tetratricopeptide (TPR) repeat protein
LWRGSGGRRGEAFALQAIGQSYARLGDAAKALEHYALCAPIWTSVGDRRGEAQTLIAAAAIHAARRDLERALDGYRAARDLAADAGVKREIGIAHTGLSAVYREQGHLETALSEARRARDILREIGERREEGRAAAQTGAVLLAAGRTTEAALAYREALSLFEAVEDRGQEAEVRARLARLAELTGDPAAARTEAMAALDLVESVRANVSAEGLSVSLFASKRPFYDEAIALLMRLEAADPAGAHAEQAFSVSERLRARALLDLLAPGALRPRDAADAALVSDLRRTQELVNGKATRLTRLLAAAGTRGARAVEATRREIDELLARLDSLRARLRQRDPELANLAHPQPLTLPQVQSELLDDRTVLLEYVLGEGQSHVWVVGAGRYVTFAAPGQAELEALARRAYEALTRPAGPGAGSIAARRAHRARSDVEFDAAARALFDALVAPAAPLLGGASRLLIVADGMLQRLPFAALPSPSRAGVRLASTHEVVLLPSASVGAALVARAASRPAPSPAIAVFADPVFSPLDARVAASSRSEDRTSDPPLPRLRFSRQEADAIARLAPRRTRIWADFGASRSAVLGAPLADYGIVHLAAHAVIDDRHPPLSSLVLSQVNRDGRAEDGRVRLHEVYTLSLNARLVVLSACRTALGRPVAGEGLIGLTRGFLHAGADAVIAALWEVDDRAAAVFMTRFYEALLARGESPAAALRAARRSMQRDARFASPRDWAAFVLIGRY